MKKSIFNIYVPITSQEQADRLKQVCIDEGLPISPFSSSFGFIFDYRYLRFEDGYFWISNTKTANKATEAEFMELLKQWKDENSKKD